MENSSPDQTSAVPVSLEVDSPAVSTTENESSPIIDSLKEKETLISPASPITPPVAPVLSNPEDDPDYDPYNPYGKDYIFEVRI